MAELQKSLETQRETQQDRISRWLSAPDPSTNHTRATRQRHDGTGLWFIHGDAFKAWKRQPGSFLWLHGIPGCGKTVLTSTIIEHLKQDMPSDVLLRFYFDVDDPDRQSLDSVLRSLIEQLSRERPEASQSLHHLWASHGGENRPPSPESLQRAFQSMLSGIGSVSIILDALDESTTRHESLNWLKMLVESETTDCRLLVTSRMEKDIESALQSWTRVEDRVSMQRNEVDKDIRAYIENILRNGAELRRWNSRPDLMIEIDMRFKGKAPGT